MFKNVLAILLLGLTANFGQANDISKNMMDYAKLLEPLQNMIEQAYDITEQIMMKSVSDPRVAAAVAQWKLLGPQFTSTAQHFLAAMAELITEGMKGIDYSKVTPQLQSFMKAMEPMTQSMGSMFSSNPLLPLMNSPLNPAKFLKIGKK